MPRHRYLMSRPRGNDAHVMGRHRAHLRPNCSAGRHHRMRGDRNRVLAGVSGGAHGSCAHKMGPPVRPRSGPLRALACEGLAVVTALTVATLAGLMFVPGVNVFVGAIAGFKFGGLLGAVIGFLIGGTITAVVVIGLLAFVSLFRS